MTPTAEQQALFHEHFRPRRDGGLDFTVQDHLRSIQLAERVGMSERRLAESLGVPVDYIRALKATMTEGQA